VAVESKTLLVPRWDKEVTGGVQSTTADALLSAAETRSEDASNTSLDQPASKPT